MKYLPALDIWNPAIAQAVRSGQLKLQRGQWLRCGSDSEPHRFVALKGNSIWAAHTNGNGSTSKHFKQLCSIA